MLVLINIETYAMVSSKYENVISNNIETDDALNGVGVFYYYFILLFLMKCYKRCMCVLL